MPIEIPWSFTKQFPLLSEWLDLEQTRAYRFPEKVQRAKVPRGELYPLARDKTYFALIQAVHPMLRFNLKELSRLMNVSYDTIRHWSKERRVLDKSREYAQKFVNYFMEDLVSALRALDKDELEGSAWSAKLCEEAACFSGLIQEIFFDELNLGVKMGSESRSLDFKLVEFVDRLRGLIRIVQPDITIQAFERYYSLAYEITRKDLESHFDYFENQININPKEAIRTARDLRADVFSILRRLRFFELSHYEVPEQRQKQRKSGTKGGLQDPVDKRTEEHSK